MPLMRYCLPVEQKLRHYPDETGTVPTINPENFLHSK